MVEDDTSADDEVSTLEAELRRRADASDLEGAVTAAIEGYGPELLGYLHAMAPSATEAEELFSELCEKVWRNLGRFRWESSFRTWSYTIARNLLRDRHRARRGPAGRVVGLADASGISKIADAVRTSTAAYLKTETKTRLEQVRDALEPDDRTLLILRVDRKLSWRDIASIMDDGEGDDSKLAARLRKRFERLKEKLRQELGVDR